MKVQELVKNYKANNPNGYFFERKTLKFFGETLSTMKVSKELVEFQGKQCYELITYQKNSPFKNKTGKFYFDCETFKYIGSADHKN